MKNNFISISIVVLYLLLSANGCMDKKSSQIREEPKTTLALSNGSTFTVSDVFVESFVIGYSVLGNSIDVTRVGFGKTVALLIIGGIHGTEVNTSELTRGLHKKYADNPGLVPSAYSVFFLDVFNPDGAALKTRYDANNVDLNRNFPTKDWIGDAFDMIRTAPGSGGSSAASEPEVYSLKAFCMEYLLPNFTQVRILVFHSACPPTGYIQPGYIKNGKPEPKSEKLAEELAKIGGYDLLRSWVDKKPITGELIHFCAENGILSMDIELPTYDTPDVIPKGKTESTFASCDRLVEQSFAIGIE